MRGQKEGGNEDAELLRKRDESKHVGEEKRESNKRKKVLEDTDA